jgi:uncharacterized protein YbjT (DUF2867 family)
MNGKTVLITGANSGIGFATSAALAVQGASIVMVCRDPERGGVARDKIAALATGAAPVLLVADLAVQAAVRKLATEVRARYTAIDVLISGDISSSPPIVSRSSASFSSPTSWHVGSKARPSPSIVSSPARLGPGLATT